MTKNQFYIPELDSLRFFAFVLVLIHHARDSELIPTWTTISRYGWIGVDIFLCLSAFLFTKLLYAEYTKTGGINVKNFYIRRGFRIWPLYFFFLALAVFLTIQKDGWSHGATIRALGMFTFTDNLMTAWFTYNTTILYSSHLWTISYEEQVYLIIPWVLLFFYRSKPSTTRLILLFLACGGTFLRAWMIFRQVGHPDIWVLPYTHFDSVLGGIVIGLGIFDRPLKKIPNIVWLLVGILALWQVTHLPNVTRIQWKLMLTYPLVGIGASLLIYSLTQGRLGILSALLQNRWLAYLGKISYGLYVYHKLGIYLANKITGQYLEPERLLLYPTVALLLAFIITVVMSTISFEVLEKPFLKLKDRFAVVQSRPV
ncbi:MAG: O-acetyltransferase OatA [Anaerolineales bacterium]|nr:O-acetyltransferase OatA [Anaerolineales bacterium]